MNTHESTAFLRSDEDDPDFLRDKPMGRCPWCKGATPAVFLARWKDRCRCANYDHGATELENRARYIAQREADAHTEERISREARRSGEEPPY